MPERDKALFNEKFNVLLIAYFNLAICQEKVGSTQYAQNIYNQGLKMSRKYLGEDHFFT